MLRIRSYLTLFASLAGALACNSVLLITMNDLEYCVCPPIGSNETQAMLVRVSRASVTLPHQNDGVVPCSSQDGPPDSECRRQRANAYRGR
jgi:hypothetical protein